MGDDDDTLHVVRIRGLPWSCTEDEIVKFFDPIEIKGGYDGIHITKSREGRPTGEAFVQFETADDITQAEKKHNEHMGRRYIEVFRARPNEVDWVVRRRFTGDDDEDDCCVKLRGLPFNCSKDEIKEFFAGLDIVPNGIALATDFQGRTTGEAFVQFVSKKMAEKGLELHKEKIGHRYIEIFPSNMEQIRAAMSGRGPGGPMRGGGGPFIGPQTPGNFNGGMSSFDNNMGYNNGPMGGGGFNRAAPYDARDRMGGANRFRGGYNNYDRPRKRPRYPTHSVHMRGLPFKAMDYDIMEFFKPLNCVNITLVKDNNGRASGEADVEFESHEDAVKAMEKHKEHMKHRYIELFLNSSPKEEEEYNGGYDMMGGGNMGGGDMMGGGNMMGGGGGGGMGGNMMGGGMGGNMMGGGGFGSMGNMGWGQGNMGWGQGNMGWGQGNMGWGQGNMGGGNMGGGGDGSNMGGSGGMGMGGNMGGGSSGMGMGGSGGMGGGMGGNMGGGMGGGMGGNMGGGMGGNMGGGMGGGMGGNMGGGGMGGNMGSAGMGMGMGNYGGGNMGGGMGGSMGSMGGPSKGDSFTGKIKPTGRSGSWNTGFGGASRMGGSNAGSDGGYPPVKEGMKKEIKSSVIESRSGDYGYGGASSNADYGYNIAEKTPGAVTDYTRGRTAGDYGAGGHGSTNSYDAPSNSYGHTNTMGYSGGVGSSWEGGGGGDKSNVGYGAGEYQGARGSASQSYSYS